MHGKGNYSNSISSILLMVSKIRDFAVVEVQSLEVCSSGFVAWMLVQHTAHVL